MGDLDLIGNIDNLNRAWRWIRSSSDATCKSYFRHLYRNYAVAEEALISDLAGRLKRGVYEPTKATKLYFPKASGVLRPFSLLTVEDQIVYQATANIVAEKLLPKVKHHYNKTVFGHLYAGKNSQWFYKKWQDSYKAFNESARKAFNDGFKYSASFDLTACFDSLDHGVLCHFLKPLRIEKEFCDYLSMWLGSWTATDKDIYHNHGLPQGPQPSGLLSEVVLSHFDTLKITGINFRYQRYVDDIRLFARSEEELRHLLVRLDLLSKDIGLFPQSSKISIHKIHDIENELKSVSNPPEPALKYNSINQKLIQKRIQELSPNFHIKDSTKFKFLLANAQPNAALTKRLWRIYSQHPEIYRSICNYLRRYKVLPRVAATEAVQTIMRCTLYQSVCAEFISAVDGRLPEIQDVELAEYIKRNWKPQSYHSDLLVASSKYLIRTGHLTSNQILSLTRNPSWWGRATLVDYLNTESVGSSARNKILDERVKDDVSDVAISAAFKSFDEYRKPESPQDCWNNSGSLFLKEVGLIQRNTANICGISRSFKKINPRISSAKWKRFFGAGYTQAEKQAIVIAALSGTNITAFVNALDVFLDLLLDTLFKKDGNIGSYQLGNIGGALKPNSRFAINYPATFRLALDVHKARANNLSHPIVKGTNKPTKPVKYQYLRKVRKLLFDAFTELSLRNVI